MLLSTLQEGAIVTAAAVLGIVQRRRLRVIERKAIFSRIIPRQRRQLNAYDTLLPWHGWGSVVNPHRWRYCPRDDAAGVVVVLLHASFIYIITLYIAVE